MEGWIESAFGAEKWVLGFVGAGLLLKKGEEHRRRKRMRRQLYEEMCRLYESIVFRISVATSVEGIKQGVPFKFSNNLNVSFDSWQFYTSEAQREFFYSLDDAGAIQEFFRACEAIAKNQDEDKATGELKRIQTAKRAAATFDEAVIQGRLSQSLLQEVAAVPVWQYIKDLID